MTKKSVDEFLKRAELKTLTAQHVRVVEIDLSFFNILALTVKAAIAGILVSIPIFIVVGAILANL